MTTVSQGTESPISIDIAGILAGFTSFALSVPFSILMPSNIDWLLGDDPAVSYLSWEFFRRDEWRMPVGLNPDFGLELSSSIVFTDSLPLFAFPAKFLTSSIDSTFQYFGIWILLCFLLQGFYAAKLAFCFGLRWTSSIPLALLTCTLPFHLTRLSYGYGHLALFGHFLILGALYLAVRATPFSRTSWILLMTVALLTMAYLFLMVFFIFLASCVERARERGFDFAFALYIAVTAIWLAIVAYVSGYFATSPESLRVGYGTYNSQLTSLFSSQARGGIYWSQLLAQSRASGLLVGDGEGFGFIGLGGLALVILALGILIRSWTEKALRKREAPQRRKDRAISTPVLFAAVTLAYLSFARTVSLGNHQIPIHPFPFEDLLIRFRSNGRFIWPLAYILIFSAARIVRKAHKNAAVMVLFAASGLQIADTTNARILMKEKLEVGYDFYSTTDAKVAKAIEHSSSTIEALRVYPPNARPKFDWVDIAFAAIKNSVATGAFTVSRVEDSNIAPNLTFAEYLKRHEDESVVVVDSESPPDLGDPDILRAWRVLDGEKLIIFHPK